MQQPAIEQVSFNKARGATRALAALVAAAALVSGCSSGNGADAVPVVRPVMAQKVATAGAGGAATVYSGEVRARREGDLGFRVPGKIVARSVDVGAAVKKGQVLARLDPVDQQMNATAARAAVAAARTDLQLASAEYDRYKSLHEKNFVARTVLDQKSATLEAARSRLEQAEAQAAVSGNQVGYTTLVADQDGIVTAIMAEAGQVVAAGQPVMRLARPDEREVLISIPETRLAATKAARSVAVRLWADPSRLYAGRVRELAPSADPGTRTFAARVSILNADAAVNLGMTANVVFGDAKDAAAAADSAVLVPLTALSRRGDQTAVWVIDAATSQVKQRTVSVRQYREDGILIGAGLQPGELIAVAGVHKLVEGQTVKPVLAEKASAPPVKTAGLDAPVSVVSR